MATSNYKSVRAFADHVPKNAAMVYATQWHVLAAELLRRLADVAEAADAALAGDFGTEAVIELGERLAVVHATLAGRSNRQKHQNNPPPETEV